MRPKFTPLFNIGFLSQEQRDYYFFNRSVHGTSYWETAIYHAVQFLEQTGAFTSQWMNCVKVGTWNSPSAFFGGYITPLFACTAAVTVSSYLGGIHHGRQPIFSLFEDVDLSKVENGQCDLEDLTSRLLHGPGTLFPAGVPYLFVCIVHGGEVRTRTLFLDSLRSASNFARDGSSRFAKFEIHCHFLPAPSSRTGGGPPTPLAASIAEEALDALNEKAELHLSVTGTGVRAIEEKEITKAFQKKKEGDEAWREPLRFQIQRTFFVFQFLATHGTRSAMSPLSLSAAGRLAVALSIADCMAEETERKNREEQNDAEGQGSSSLLALTQESGRFLDPRMLERYHGWNRLDSLGQDQVNIQSTTKQVAAFLEDVVTFQKRAARIDGEGHLLYLLISSLERAPLLLSVSPIFAEKALPLFLLLNKNDKEQRRRYLFQIQSFLAAFRQDQAFNGDAKQRPKQDDSDCGVSGLDAVLFRLQMFFRDMILKNQWDRLTALATAAIEACKSPATSGTGSRVYIAFFLRRLLLDSYYSQQFQDTEQEEVPNKEHRIALVCKQIALQQMEREQGVLALPPLCIPNMEGTKNDSTGTVQLLHRIGTNLSFGQEATLASFPPSAFQRAKELETFFAECPDLLNEPRFLGLWSLSYLFLILRDMFTYKQQVQGLDHLLSVLKRFIDRKEEEGSWLFQVPTFRDTLHRTVLLLCFPERAGEWKMLSKPDDLDGLEQVRLSDSDVPSALDNGHSDPSASDLTHQRFETSTLSTVIDTMLQKNSGSGTFETVDQSMEQKAKQHNLGKDQTHSETRVTKVQVDGTFKPDDNTSETGFKVTRQLDENASEEEEEEIGKQQEQEENKEVAFSEEENSDGESVEDSEFDDPWK